MSVSGHGGTVWPLDMIFCGLFCKGRKAFIPRLGRMLISHVEICDNAVLLPFDVLSHLICSYDKLSISVFSVVEPPWLLG